MGVISSLARRIWSGHGALAMLGRMVLWPFTLAYRAGLQVNRRRIAAGPRFDLPVPVVIVGNLTVGGTGKTPVVAWIAAELRRAGRRPVIVSRGYGGRRRLDPAVVSDGRTVRLGPRQAGDEPVMLARMLPGIPVVVGRDRVAAARLAVRRLGANVLVLDDAFQQRVRFPRAFNVVTCHGHQPAGNGLLLPAGPLREPVTALLAADVLLPRGGLSRAGRRALGAGVARLRIIPWNYELLSLRALAGTSVLPPPAWLRGQRVLAVSGIGDPDGFVSLLQQQTGIGRIERFEMPDHHVWTRDDVGRVAQAATATGCSMLITTQKDAVKWPADTPASLPLFIANAGIRLTGKYSLRELLQSYLRGFRR